MKIKVCGMKYEDNIRQVAALQPDYLGFIFYAPSPRNFEGDIPPLDPGIRKTGVFVNAPLETVLEKISLYGLDAVQLHGDESPEYCLGLRQTVGQGRSLELIKVFSVGRNFDFGLLQPYEAVADLFLFDALGSQRGGNGVPFDWSLLEGYGSDKPFILSGGIGPWSVKELKEFLVTDKGSRCLALDLNSGFEDRPGWKNEKELSEFIHTIKNE